MSMFGIIMIVKIICFVFLVVIVTIYLYICIS